MWENMIQYIQHQAEAWAECLLQILLYDTDEAGKHETAPVEQMERMKKEVEAL